MNKCLLSSQEIGELENLECADPFNKLGYHHVIRDRQTVGVIRVFNPQIRKVEILWDGQSQEAGNSSGTGCFEAVFPERLEFFPYRIRATYLSGESQEYDDPYAFLPVLTILGLQFAYLVACTVIVENVFYLPGLGRLIFDAITARDLVLVRSAVMILVVVVIGTMFLTELAYGWVDPRLRARSTE